MCAVLPLGFVLAWATLMEGGKTGGPDCSSDSCWPGWSHSPYLFYLVAAPMLIAYGVFYSI